MKTAAAPLVSILTTVYNTDAEFLREAIDSILAQTYQNIELIIVNDGSTNNARETISAFTDTRIVLIDNPTNIGIPKATNMGLNACHGKYIARMDSDDISLPERIEKQVHFMESHPTANVVGSYQRKIGLASGLCKVRLPAKRGQLQAALFLYNCQMPHSAVMLRAAFLQQYGISYNERYLKSLDYGLWVECSRYTAFHIIKEVLILYRVHQKQISSIASAEQVFYAELARFDQIERLQIILTDEHKRIHNTFLDRGMLCPVTEELFDWVTLLQHANRTQRIFEHQYFCRELNFRLFYLCVTQVMTQERKDPLVMRKLLSLLTPYNVCRYYLANRGINI